MTQQNSEQKLGIWFVGALGDVATTTVVGLLALKHKLIDETGLTTALPQFAGISWNDYDQFVFGGHDVREGSWLESAHKLHSQIGCFSTHMLKVVGSELETQSANIRLGILRGTSTMLDGVSAEFSKSSANVSAKDSVQKACDELNEFRETNQLSQVIVVHLTSTEPSSTESAWQNDLQVLHDAIEADDQSVPASVLYAYASFKSHCHFINFTPCLGSSLPCLDQFAVANRCVHAGRDGKTGETLLRTVLAPMFAARHLRVLSWSGFNILGNRDGQVLSDPKANEAKTSGKDAVLKSVLGDLLGESLTRIDYVQSLKDFKTAWDFIHFEGFLNTKMSMQITWQGADSALAAPLVIDLVRIVAQSAARGHFGIRPELSCFFKNPIQSNENAFDKQFFALTNYILTQLTNN